MPKEYFETLIAHRQFLLEKALFKSEVFFELFQLFLYFLKKNSNVNVKKIDLKTKHGWKNYW